MPIDIQCQQCGSKFRVEDRLAGKRVKCAKCTGIFVIPAAAVMPDGQTAPAKPVMAAPAAKPALRPSGDSQPQTGKLPAPAADNWYMQTQEGDQYGPVSKQDLDGWIAEGRIDAACQVLCEGWEQWKWAEEVYPQLSMAHISAPRGMQSTAAEEDPLESLGLTQPAAAATRASPSPPGIPEAVAFTEIGPSIPASPHRRTYQSMRVAIDWLPVCSWIILALGGFLALFSAYEFFNLLGDVRSVAPGSSTARFIIVFLWWEGFVLVNTFLGFIGLRALSDWMAIRLGKQQQDRVNSEVLAKAADALVKKAESSRERK